MTQDLRVVKTQAAIQQAFWTLLATRPLQKIAIADLVASAHIGKATFYHHYVDKYDLARQLGMKVQAPVIAECVQRIHSQHLDALWQPMPSTILQQAHHIRLLDTIQAPEFNGQTTMITALEASFRQALVTRDPRFKQLQSVSLELATLYQHVVIVDLIGDGQDATQPMTALKQAIPLIFPQP